MKTYKELLEARAKDTIVFFFGRCNPPTPGHVLVFNVVVATAKKLGADYNIIVSRTQDKKSNPLSLEQKLHYLKIQCPKLDFIGATDTMRTPIEVLKAYDKKYKNIVMIAGGERVEQFQKLFDQYNGKAYNFNSIKVLSAGVRDPDADDITGMSASKMRAIASEGDYDKFKKGLMPYVRDIDGKRMMNDVRIGMGLTSIKGSIKLNTSDIREKYRAGDIFAEDTFVESNAVVYKIINRNNNYLTLVNESGIISKKWLTDVLECTPNSNVINKFGEITEMKFSSSDKIKVAKIIGGMLGADVEKSSNPEQIVNAGLRIAKSKPLNDEAVSILKKMLQTADDAGIKYDTKLIPTKITNENAGNIDSADFKIGKKGQKIRARTITFDDEINGNKLPIVSPMESFSEKKLDPTEEHHQNIKVRVAQAHAQGQRHITLYKKDQIVADKEHLALNQMGGRQVGIPHGATMGAPVDTGHGRMVVMKQLRNEGRDQVNDSNPQKDFELDDKDTYKDPMGMDMNLDFSAEDEDNIVDSIKDENDILSTYDDSELHLVDSETGEDHGSLDKISLRPEAAVGEVPDAEKDMYNMDTVFVKDFTKYESVVNEVLTRQDRIKASIRMRVHHGSLERKIQLALKKHSNSSTLAHRAKKLAISAMKVKMMHKPIDSFSMQDKERAEKMIQSRRAVINRIALRLIPKIREIERNRLSQSSFTQPSKGAQ